MILLIQIMILFFGVAARSQNGVNKIYVENQFTITTSTENITPQFTEEITHQFTGVICNEDVIFQGQLQLQTGLCLDNWGMRFGYEMLGFGQCNGGETQQWKVLSNGQIVQKITGLCVSYYAHWTNLMITKCNNTDQLQFWTHSSTQDSQWQWVQFTNVGYTEQKGDQQCLVVVDGQHAQLTECSKVGNQLIRFSVWATIFEGQIYSPASYLCLDNLVEGSTYLGFTQYSGDQKQQWKYLSNGQIIQQSRCQCIQQFQSSKVLVLRDCQMNYTDQIWSYEIIRNQQLRFVNMRETMEEEAVKCMVQDGEYAKLHDCNISEHDQIFTFGLSPPQPPSPPLPSPPSPTPTPTSFWSPLVRPIRIRVYHIIIAGVVFVVLIATWLIFQNRNKQKQQDYCRQQLQQKLLSNEQNSPRIYNSQNVEKQLLNKDEQVCIIYSTCNEATCYICQSVIFEGERKIILPCGHEFHKECLQQSQKNQKGENCEVFSCPFC